ncbi:Sodium/hydrogen exchanger 8, partial [Bienertia sinuspersici]
VYSSIAQIVLLAGPGVQISTFVIGVALKLSFPYDWNWTRSLLLGGILSTTDPVAVVALLKELGVSKKLSTIIEGESLINDECVLHAFFLVRKECISTGSNYKESSYIELQSEI